MTGNALARDVSIQNRNLTEPHAAVTVVNKGIGRGAAWKEDVDAS